MPGRSFTPVASAVPRNVTRSIRNSLPATPSPAYRRRRVDRFGTLTAALGRLVLARPRALLGLAALAVLAGGAGASRLRLDDERIRAFRGHEPIVQVDRAINAHLAGTNNIDVLIEGAAPQALHRPENLRRIEAPCGFEIDTLPPPLPIFSLIRKLGELDAAEMATVFNLGVGLTVTVAESDAERALAALRGTGVDAWRLGRAVADPERAVRILPERLVGRSKLFTREP